MNAIGIKAGSGAATDLVAARQRIRHLGWDPARAVTEPTTAPGRWVRRKAAE